MPLPNDWELAIDPETGRKYFVNHNTKETQWFDPRDVYTKPATFADCIGDELPVGWEQANHPLLGNYFIDHKRRINQLDDPRIELLAVQANMVIGYLEQASILNDNENENERESSTQQQQQEQQQIYSNTESMIAAAAASTTNQSSSSNEMTNNNIPIENDYMNRNDLALAIQNIQIDDLSINNNNNHNNNDIDQYQQQQQQQQMMTTSNTSNNNNNRSINKINLQFDENSAYAVIDCYSIQQKQLKKQNDDIVDNYANLSLYNNIKMMNISQSNIDTINDQSTTTTGILPPALPSIPPPISSIRSAISSHSIGNNYSNNSRTSSIQSLIVIPSHNNNNHYGQLSQQQQSSSIITTTNQQYRQNPLLLQQSLNEAKQRVEQLKQSNTVPTTATTTTTIMTNNNNDHNHNILSIIDRYYTKDGQKHTNAIEV
ncbi:regulation of hippo signaling [Dermatophagoides pteronyssinus]|uniref:Regulation of hippo signaling n=1 Tax=Dermatophagoides pteronyssinus TaxID=6956 RepID=A0ABQ8JGB5_DERPT|nr:regulation of hippo signaling [Dermatophagoides pteronyssinus]